jgi:threonine dehydratase
MIHPFENEDVMAGQGTLAIELLEEVPDLDLILCPVGGGGVISGTAVAAKSLRPSIKVIATEPAGADDAAQSFHERRLVRQENKNTIADGLRTDLGSPNFDLIQRYVDDVVTVSEEGIITAMRAMWETMKIVVEPSGAVSHGAVMEDKVDCRSKRVAIIVTGGNVDLDALPWMKF